MSFGVALLNAYGSNNVFIRVIDTKKPELKDMENIYETGKRLLNFMG